MGIYTKRLADKVAGKKQKVEIMKVTFHMALNDCFFTPLPELPLFFFFIDLPLFSLNRIFQSS